MTRKKFRVLAALGTGCRVVGWLLGVLVLVAQGQLIKAILTSEENTRS